MSNIKKVICPHCGSSVDFQRNSSGKWIGTLGGGGTGLLLAKSLGIAGTIFGAPVAIPAAFAGLVVGTIIGNRIGDIVDNSTGECPNCKKNLSL